MCRVRLSRFDIRNRRRNRSPRTNYYAGYFKDTWRVTDHLTVNIGVRFDQQRAFLTEQSKEASPNFPTLFPAATFAPLDVLTWNSLVPRLGFAWDVAERTVIKGTFGVYSNGLSDNSRMPTTL